MLVVPEKYLKRLFDLGLPVFRLTYRIIGATRMPPTIAELVKTLSRDPWRDEVGFSQAVDLSNRQLFDPSVSDDAAAAVLNAWLQKHQPCLFGRIAAKLGLLSYCILTPSDLSRSDEFIRDKIQKARSQWTRDAFEGKKSGFVILAISPEIAYALPDTVTMEVAKRLCQLYLLKDVEADEMCLDEIFLERPDELSNLGPPRRTWRWDVGVNYFCAQGDMRWWQDHRIPGGMAFSMNSVGHMARTGAIGEALEELLELSHGASERWVPSKVNSLGRALEFAMRTIAGASDAVSGKATQLLPLPTDLSELPVTPCPVDLPGFLRDKNYCSYLGYYHTDVTIPSEYFTPDVLRPNSQQSRLLDFTYLFDERVDNPAFITMGEGRPIRAGESQAQAEEADAQRGKVGKSAGELVETASCERLLTALNET